MKKCTAIIFYSALFFLFSCTGGKKENVQQQSTVGNDKCPVTTDTIRIHEEYTFAYDKENSPKLTIDIALPRFDLDNAEANANLERTLAEGLFFYDITTLQAACDFCVVEQKEMFNELRDEYNNLSAGEIPPGLMGCYCDIKGRSVSGYKGYISYIMTREEYWGGAHPNTVNTIVSFDPETGCEIGLDDIFKGGYEDALLTMLVNRLMEDEGATTMEALYDAGYYMDTDMYISQNFILGNDGVTFLYNRYEIAPYAKGDILITLDYKTLKDIMK